MAFLDFSAFDQLLDFGSPVGVQEVTLAPDPRRHPCFDISMIQRLDRPRIPRFHVDPTLFKHIQYFSKVFMMYWDLLMF